MENTTEQKTYFPRDFIAKFNLVMTWEKTTREDDGTKWSKGANHYRVRVIQAVKGCHKCAWLQGEMDYPKPCNHNLHTGKETTYEVTYSKGEGHRVPLKDWQKKMGIPGAPIPPTIEEVVTDILIDSVPFCWGHITYENWADEFGYDKDSRKGEAIFRETEKNVLAFRNLIGAKAFAEMVPHFRED